MPELKHCGNCTHFNQDFHYCNLRVQEMTKANNWLEFNKTACEKWEGETAMPDKPWMAIAKKEMGIHEVPGRKDNPRIVEYLESTDYDLPEQYEDEVPWCSGFVNWCLRQCNIKGTNSAWSQSWLHWGNRSDPIPGAIVVFSWGGGKGHVGFVADCDENAVTVLGGNQHDSVNFTRFSYDNIMAFRWPKEA